MKIAARIGITISEFWRITPYELFIYMKAFEEKEKEHSKEILIQEY